MLDKKNLVSTMVSQHRTLQKDLGSESEMSDAGELYQGLEKFTKDLTEHLELENGTFYPELLKGMKEKGQDTSKTEEFVAKMKGIEKVVHAFLGKFNSAENIQKDIPAFKEELSGIVDALNLRIESEEAGVYAYWGLF